MDNKLIKQICRIQDNKQNISCISVLVMNIPKWKFVRNFTSESIRKHKILRINSTREVQDLFTK